MASCRLIDEFKQHYISVLDQTDPNIPIIASIGKQSHGKSFFLSKLLSANIPHKHNQCIDKGTNILYHQSFNNFLLLDMEGMEGDAGNSERDILNFSSSFAIADILLLHISQEELENSQYKESLSYVIWNSLKIAMKFNLNMPEIIILIRDPRIAAKNEETIEYYNKLIKQFEGSINEVVEGYEKKLIEVIENVLIKTTKDKKDEKKMAEEAIKKLKEEALKHQIKISKHFTIYFRDSFEDDEDPTYHEMKIINGKILLPESNFPELLEFINNKSVDIINKRNSLDSFEDCYSLENEITINIQQRIKEHLSNCKSRKIIFESIYIECKHNIFSHYRNFNGLIRFFEKYNTYSIRIEKLTEKISKNVKKDITDKKIIELKNKHKKEIDSFINENFDEENSKIYTLAYLKYITADCFCNTFCLRPGVPDSISYQALYTIIHYQTPGNISHQLEQVKKNIKLFDCLSYNDSEFTYILQNKMTINFQLFITLYYIYKRKIEESREQSYGYKEDITNSISDINENNYVSNIGSLVDIFRDLVPLNFWYCAIFNFIERSSSKFISTYCW